ncbi:RNA 2'-phosphotransferase [Ruminococcus sp.]|nr:RNA 2'-phosphotransferase [Ruminococcus sp.]
MNELSKYLCLLLRHQSEKAELDMDEHGWAAEPIKACWQKRINVMKNKKQGNNWTAYYDNDTKRYFAEIMYTSREGREQYDYEITQDIYARLGTFSDDVDNERLIKTGKSVYSFENTMYGTLGPERTVWDEEANETMNKCVKKNND